jgi:hypothetical protein
VASVPVRDRRKQAALGELGQSASMLRGNA